MATANLADGTAVSPRALNTTDPRQPGLSFHDMLSHAGHTLTIRVYRTGALTIETALVCTTCGRELRTASNPTINGTIQFRVITIYVDETGANKALPLIVKAETWNGRRAAIDEAIYSRIPKERVQSVLVDDSTSPALFESFWTQLQAKDDGSQASH